MVKKIASYKLINGCTPESVIDAGYFCNIPNDSENMICVGVIDSEKSLDGVITIFESEELLFTYLSSFLTDNVFIDLNGQEKRYSLRQATKDFYAKIA